MQIIVEHNKTNYKVDLSNPLNISIPISPNSGVKCFYAEDVVFSPFVSDNFIGSVKAGAPVNYFNVAFNPHGNGTHTECLGHITEEQESVNNELKDYHFIVTLISVVPIEIENGDSVITLEAFTSKFPNGINTDALIVRTLPNAEKKLNIDYTETNPTYITPEAMEYLVSENVEHLLIDLPSVDREKDEGKLAAHHIFWGINKQIRKHCTITELVYIPNTIEDGLYFLNLQVAPLELDASPSKPILYHLQQTN